MLYHAPCALRAFRRMWGLSQRELARLLGFESSAEVSRIEHGKRTPLLETALACSTLFGVSLRELFPDLAAQTEEKLSGSITRLRRSSPHSITPLETRKRELFDAALERTHEGTNSASV